MFLIKFQIIFLILFLLQRFPNFKRKKMPRSHHRKKHKEHVRQFKHTQEGFAGPSPSARTRASVIMGIAGALIGSAVAYFATNGSIPWVAGGFVAGAIGGYYVGKMMDKAS